MIFPYYCHAILTCHLWLMLRSYAFLLIFDDAWLRHIIRIKRLLRVYFSLFIFLLYRNWHSEFTFRENHVALVLIWLTDCLPPSIASFWLWQMLPPWGIELSASFFFQAKIGWTLKSCIYWNLTLKGVMDLSKRNQSINPTDIDELGVFDLLKIKVRVF